MSCELLARGGNRSAATRPGTKVVTTRGGRRLCVLRMHVCRVYTAIIIMCSGSKLKKKSSKLVNLVPRSSEHHSSLHGWCVYVLQSALKWTIGTISDHECPE